MTPTDEAATPPAVTPLSARDRWLVALAAWLLGGPLRLVTASWRIRVVSGEEHVDRLLAEGSPAILASWHNRMIPVGQYIAGRWIAAGHPVTGLASLSRDGELMARLLTRVGYRVVRGSPTRGGLRGLRRLHRVLTRERSSIGLSPDGSQGPIYECKTGVVILAQLSGAPIVPISSATNRCWRARSWDRLILPKPFARIALAIGEPITAAAELSTERLEQEARRVGDALDRLGEAARAGLATLR